MPSRTGGCQDRVSSPPGASTLTTSAPRSASSMVAYGPARIREKPATSNPDNGPVTPTSLRRLRTTVRNLGPPQSRPASSHLSTARREPLTALASTQIVSLIAPLTVIRTHVRSLLEGNHDDCRDTGPGTRR